MKTSLKNVKNNWHIEEIEACVSDTWLRSASQALSLIKHLLSDENKYVA